MKKIALFVLSLALMLGVFSGLTAQTLLWTEDFGATAPTGWTVVNAGNGNNWNLTGTGSPYNNSGYNMQYGYNNSNAANTWAFTHGIFMTAGNDYYLTFYQRVHSASYNENMKVTVGNAQTVASQTTTLLDLPSMINTTYTQRTTAYYRPTTTNIYYFAFNCYSAANMWNLYVDLVQAYEIDNSGIANPTSFTATASSATQIDLSWALNATPDNVLLAWNTTNTFGTPSGSYTAGDAITGGGTVLLANSSATSFNHTSLTHNTTYYYRIWSQNGAGPTYSGGAAANATTFMAPITSFPWTETFETTSSTRAGWSQIQEFGDKSWTWATGAGGGLINTAHDGTLNARYTGSTYNGHITKLVTPTLDLSGVTNPTLSFWYGQEAWGSDQNTLAIYYRTSPTGAWTQIGSDYTSNISSWTQVTGIFLPNPSSTYQLAFEGTDNYGYANVLDDVVVSGFSGVLDPTTFTATAVSSTQIDLSWVLNSTPDNVLLAWNTTNTFGTPSGSYTAGDAITGGGTVLLANSSATSFNHSGLTHNTTYYYRIWSQNGAGPTYSSGVDANATTPLAPYNVPFTEDFEVITTAGTFPPGWTRSGGTNWTSMTSSSTYNRAPRSGTDYLTRNYSTTSDWMFSRAINLDASKHYDFGIWYNTDGNSGWTSFKMYIGSSATGAAMSTELAGINSPTNTSYAQLSRIGWQPPSTGIYYVGLQVASTGSPWYMSFDDFSVIENSGVIDPTSFTATAVSSTQIDLSWVLNSTPDNVLLAWNTTNTFGTPSGSYTAGDAITGGGTVLLANSSATSFNHSGLTHNTTYYYRIWSQNGAGPTYSNGVAANATTPMAPITSFPWTETFETTSSTRAGWSQIQETGTQSWTWATGSSGGSITTAHDGTLNARYTGSSRNGYTTKLVTPTLDLSGVTNPTLSFWYGQEAWSSDQNTLAIYYRTSPTGAWTQIGSDYTGNISSWTQVIGILLPNPSSTYQLAFEGTDNWGRANVLDDVVVSGFSGVLDPTSFTATAVSSTQIDLSWVLNSTPDNVLLAWNTTNTFGTPSGSYTVGDAITGGGTVLLANSSATSFNHSGLTPNTTYYYMIWSQNGAGPTYSNGVDANATTQAPPVTSFPFTESFDGTAFPPTGWTLDTGSYPWIRVSTGIYPTISPYAGDGMAKYSCYDYYTGSTGLLVTPPLNLPSDGFAASFWMYRDTGYSGNADLVNVYYNTTNSLTGATLLGTVNRNTTRTPAVSAEGWYKYFFNLPSGSSGNGRFVIFEGVSAYGNNIYVDEIEISIPSPELTLSESSYNFGLAFVNASNCTPRYFIAENTGVGTATIASAPQFTGTDASEFTLIDTNTYPIALNASESAYWGVKFTPSSYGEKTAYLSITDDTKAKGISFFTAEEIPAAAKGAKAASNPTAKSMDVLPKTTVKTRATNNVSLRGFAVGEVYEDNFDNYADFTQDLTPWAQYDGDLSTTATINGVTFTNQGYTGSYIIFNPANTNPALTNINYAPYSGAKYAACFCANTPPNNDWLISPALNFGESPRVSFFARSVTDSYGLERFKVLYSTTGNAHTDFTNYLAGSATTYVEAPTEWTLYEYELPAACENTIAYIAIQCVSDDAFILMVDDFVAGDFYSVQTPVELSSFTATFTVGNYVNLTWVTQSETGVQGFYILRNTQDNLANATVISPLVPATNTSQQQVYTYTDMELSEDGTYYYWLQNSDMDGSINYHGPVSIDYTVQGSSTPEIPLVTELKSVFPNPFNPIAYIPYSIGKNEGPADVSFRIYNSRGQLVFSKDVKNQNTGMHQIQWHGKDNNGNACGTGLYFVRMDVGGKSYTRRAVLIK